MRPALDEVVEHVGHGNRSELLRLAVRDYQGRFRLEQMRDVARAVRTVGQSGPAVEGFVATAVQMCEFSGGAVIEPQARDHGVSDHEDNLIVFLAKDPAIDALIS